MNVQPFYCAGEVVAGVGVLFESEGANALSEQEGRVELLLRVLGDWRAVGGGKTVAEL